ncbi:hypothetical protein Y032_0110g172 [Ancylostoma ceylanicum]|uniref:Uncharacterized protein n=1 Tax=Ancylostoma ceylanicum TaxID=53326 RepID=A0A016TEI8_9BILA|nr:hypothetical protein Y032_0110g172 [Ancylostoma ceylanicum]
MNNDGSPASTIAPTLDLQALLATMPDFSMMNNLQNSMPKDRSTGENSIPTSQSLLFPTIPNDQLAALSLGLFPLPGFPMFPLLPMGPMGTSGLPPHSTIESLGLMTNNLRQSTSTTATSMAPPSLDIRPRAFSSAAALQRPKQAATPERRRKRSRKTQEEENEGSVLRMLMDEEDDTPIKIRQQAPTKDLDEKLRMDAAKGERCSMPILGAGGDPSAVPIVTSNEFLLSFSAERQQPAAGQAGLAGSPRGPHRRADHDRSEANHPRRGSARLHRPRLSLSSSP